MMKKHFSMICLILALILVLPTLASCKGEMPDGGETSLTESTAKPSVEDTSEQGGDSNAESETDTESDTVGGANVELEGEHADLISHSHEVKNKVNAYYADGDMSSFAVENENMSLLYNLKNGKKQVSALLNSNGAAYFENTSDVYIKTDSGSVYYASRSQQSAFPNFYQHGYYYYEVGIEGQSFAADISEEDIPEGGVAIDHASIKASRDLKHKKTSGGSMRFVISNTEYPCVTFDNVVFSADEHNLLLITMKADERINESAKIYLAVGDRTELNNTTKLGFQLTCDGEWRTYCILLDQMPDYYGDVTAMRLDIGGEINASFEISEMRVVAINNSDSPSAVMNRVYHTYSDKLYEMMQIAAYREHDNVSEIGVVTRISADTVERLIIADKHGEKDSLDGMDSESVGYVGFLIKDAGVFGYILPAGEYQGGLKVDLVDGEYVVYRYSAPEDGRLTPPDATLGNANDFYLGHRIYTDMTTDFEGLRRAARDEREPLGEEDFTVVGENDEDVKFLGYDALTGTYRFSVETGIYSFNVPYYNMPNKQVKVNFTVKSDCDREIFVEIVTGSGQLECAALLSGRDMMLPVPMEVCKNFPNEESPTQIDMLDTAYGNIYFPLKLAAGKTYEYNAVALWQNWGRYPLKQLSSIAFVSPYYHLSTGVIETNCITMYPSTTRLPDFRSMSAPFWATQPAHTRGGWHEFLTYTDENGNTVEEIHKTNEIISYGPTYASVRMEFISTDGRIKSTYTHTEMPQTDENRTFYTLRYEVLEDISFGDFMKEFSIYSVKSMGGRYSHLGYLDENNKRKKATLSAADGNSDIYRLGDIYPYFSLYTMVDYTGTPTDMGPDNYVNVACIIKSRNITVGGEKCDASFVIVEDGGFASLSLELGEITLRAGDVFEIEMILLPWGSQESSSDKNVQVVRNNTLVSPIKATAEENCNAVDCVVPTVNSLDGKSASFTLNPPGYVSDGINMTVRVQGMKKLTAPVIYELVDGKWQIYEVSSAKSPDKSGNAYAYDGYGVEYAGDGTYTYSFVVTIKDTERSFRLVAEDDFTEWPEVEIIPDASGDKLQVYLDPEELYDAAQFGKDMGEMTVADDRSYITFKSKAGVVESFFTAYSNSTYHQSGQYFVIRYRAEKDMGNIEVFASTKNISAVSGDNVYLRSVEGMLICNGEWQVAVVDLSKAVKAFSEKEGVGYFAKYIRLDIINRAFDEEQSIDVAYIGLSNSLEDIIALNGDMSSIMMLDGVRVYDLLEESSGEDEIKEPDPINWYLDPREIVDASKTKYTQGFSGITLSDDGEYVRFTGDSAKTEGFFATFIDDGIKSGKYAVIKYRIPTTNPETLVNFEIFTGEVNSVPTSGDNFRIEVVHDGEWHTLVIDLTKVTNKEGEPIASGDDFAAKYFRVDLFNKAVSSESYIDVAFIGLSDNLDDISKIEGETPDDDPSETAAHSIITSVYNENDGNYDQTCSHCTDIIKSPINYVIPAEMMKFYYANATNLNFSEPVICKEDGVSFARYTKTESGAAFFFPYSKNNTTLSTGEYFVIKYRVTGDATTQTSWSICAGTETMKALSADDAVITDTPFYADSEWHIAVIKLDNTKGNFRFIPDENGVFYANYVRVGYSSAESGSCFDIQYAGFADDPSLIVNLTGEESFGEGVTCTHYSVLRVNDRQTHVGECLICGERVEEPHSIAGDAQYSESDGCYLGTCAVCGGVASTPFNLTITPEDIVDCFGSSSYGKANLGSVEHFAANDDGVEFARITPKTAQSWMNLYLYLDLNAKMVTGQYAVIKYRIPDTTYAKSSIICYTGSAASSTEKATVGASFTFSNVTASGEWIIAVYDMSKTSEYGANEDGTFSAKYLRLDMLVDEYADVAFFGICDEIGAISSVAEGAVCHHPYYNYSSDAETHTRTECAICREAVAEPIAEAHSYSASTYDGELGGYVLSCTLCKKSVIIEGNSALTVFFDPALIKNSEHSGYSNPFTSASLLSDASESLFLRLSGPGIGSSAIPFTTLIHNKVSVNTNSAVGRYIIIKYRYSASLEGKVTTANLFISSLSDPTASENNKLTTYVTADGNWHYIIIDAKNIGTTEGFEGDIITLLRFDMIKDVTPTESDYVDIAYVAIDESIDALRRFDGEYDTYGLVGSSELKGTIGDIATEKTDSGHNNMPYVTITGKSGNFTLINNQNIFFQGTGKYAAMLYRKDNSNPALSAGRLYFSTVKNYDNSVLVPYTSDGKWHLGLFDMSEYAAYADGMAKTIRFDWFNFNSTTSSIDIAYVKFFDSLDEAYGFYGEYVKKYLDAESCDHYMSAWDYGQDSDPSTDVLKEFGKCAHCVAQMDASRNVSFGLELDRVSDSVSCYPSAYDAAVGNSENEVLVFNSAEFSEIYPADGIHVAVGQEISIAGVLTMKDAVGAFWFKVTESDGNTVSDWRECRYALSSSTVPEGLVATKFAAYANLDGVSGTGLKVIFAVIPQGLPESITDRYLPVTSIENVSIDENITEKVGFTASGDLGILMDDIFDGNRVVNETIMFLDYGESRTLLYDIDRIISVKSFDGTVTYVEGMDYALVDGKIQILEGSSIPCITSDIYYGSSQYDLITSKDGVPTPTYEGEGKSMTRWQVNVEYEHSGSYVGHKQNDQSDYFADFIEKLMNGEDVTVFYFGDSITVGASSTFYNGYAPYQYGYAYLLTHALADVFGYTVKYVDTEGLKVGMIKPPPAEDYVGGTRGTITYVNTAVGGWTSADGWSNFEKHVADYIREYGCDLFVCGFGMNDKNLDAAITAENIGKIVDGVIALEPDTAVMLVASMLYNNTDVYAETYNANIKNQDSALKTLAESYRDKGIECGVASVGLVSESVLERKEFRDYTGNNINHPNDFFCRIYAQTVFKALIGYENLAD